MKPIMDWGDCMNNHIKKIEIDNDKIASIKKMCFAREKLLVKAELDDETASIIAADYYEIIKELLVALMLKEGLKCDNHECLVSYFMNRYPEREYETNIIHQLKYVRNRLEFDNIIKMLHNMF
jgi:hypothetical protein